MQLLLLFLALVAIALAYPMGSTYSRNTAKLTLIVFFDLKELQSLKTWGFKVGFKIDNDGKKILLTDDQKYGLNSQRAATHPYIFEFIWELFLTSTDIKIYKHLPFALLNRKDILEII